MLTELLLKWAHAPACGRAFHFRSYSADDGAPETVVLPFAALVRRAMGTARALARETAPGDRVLIATEAGLSYHLAFFGCVLAGVIPVPLPEPITPAQIARCRASALDCDAALALIGPERSERTRAALHEAGLPCLAVAPDAPYDDFVRERSSRYGDLAYLQYTSGSTGRPKGVMVGDSNLQANLRLIEQRLHLTDRDRVVSWLPPYHDMGLVVGLLLPLFTGTETLVMRAREFSADPMRWLSTIAEFRATMSIASNFAYELCTQRAKACRPAFDLRSLRLLISGAESVRAQTVRGFLDAFAASGVSERHFLAGYGLAEATLLVSIRDPARDPLRILTIERTALARGEVRLSAEPGAMRVVSCGRPGPGVQLCIVDPQSRVPLASGRVGEIWTAGPSVCPDVWARDRCEGLVRMVDDQRGATTWLRTGDLGFVHDDELFVTGRLKDLIIAHGANLHPEDLEASIEAALPCLESGRCAVFEVERGNRAGVVVAVEAPGLHETGQPDVCQAVVDVLRRTYALIPDEVLWLRGRQLARTTSGKLARAACRDIYERNGYDVARLWTRERR